MSFCDRPDCDYCAALVAALNEYLLDQMPLAEAAEQISKEIENYLKDIK
jgi:hypothetical protein